MQKIKFVYLDYDTGSFIDLSKLPLSREILKLDDYIHYGNSIWKVMQTSRDYFVKNKELQYNFYLQQLQ